MDCTGSGSEHCCSVLICVALSQEVYCDGQPFTGDQSESSAPFHCHPEVLQPRRHRGQGEGHRTHLIRLVANNL